MLIYCNYWKELFADRFSISTYKIMTCQCWVYSFVFCVYAASQWPKKMKSVIAGLGLFYKNFHFKNKSAANIKRSQEEGFNQVVALVLAELAN